jgi:hypothetical protein
MIQLFIPLTGLISAIAYYFLSQDMKISKRASELEKKRSENSTPGSSEKYYGWELHDLI